MTAETGHYALILALLVAVVQGVLPLYGAQRGDRRIMALAPAMAQAQLLLVTVAFICLTALYLRSDFSVFNVFQNSHSAKPLIYKLSGVWGNHEGSLLLWTLVLALFGAAIAWFGARLPPTLQARTLAVQGLIGVGFLAFMLFTSNPFARLSPAPLEGQGLNPLLQDPGLAAHPPLLYIGYVGFSVAFSFAVAALIEGRVDPAWARWVRPWTLAAWVFLTLGIAVGSYWAYYELGWGGWWFWDPVENASFMPWLAGTALLHSAIVVERRDALKVWTVLLAILTFSLSLLGTFIVRSGVLNSVHAFATDPARGVFILGFLVVVVGGSLLLFAIRAPAMRPGGLFAPVSREGALVLNNLFLASATAAVLVGTLYPLFIDAVAGAKVSVGPPYFNAVFIPLMTPLVIALGVGPMLAWKRADLAGALARLKLVAVVAAVTLVVMLWLTGERGVFPALGVALGVWLFIAVLVDLAERTRLSWTRAAGLPRATWGMTVAHFGVAVCILGMAVSGAFTEEKLLVLRAGDRVEIGPYTLTFEGAGPVQGPNYLAEQGRFRVFAGERELETMTPETRRFRNPPMETTEAAIRETLLGDLYVVIGQGEGGGVAARVYWKPLIVWIWLGAGLMSLGGLLSLSDRRLRIALPARRRTGAEAAATP